MKKLRLTQEGIENLKKEVEAKREELRELGRYKGHAAENEGDAWHDNFAFEQTEIKERSLLRQIDELQKQISMAQIIEVTESSDNEKVAINSKVKVLIKYDEDDTEELDVILVGSQVNLNSASEFDEISINSPMGEAIYQKKVGFEGYYTVNGNKIYFKILSVTN